MRGLILIAGGSASGKTILARALHGAMPGSCLIAQDSFYRCETMRPRDAKGRLDFDIPEAIDFAAMFSALSALIAGKGAQIPRYDFVTHRRVGHDWMAPPETVLIAEGTLLLHRAEIRALTAATVFVQADEALRTARRIRRDTSERGRQLDDVHRQLSEQVLPAHDRYVEPCAAFARYRLQARRLEADLDCEVADLKANLAALLASGHTNG
jgi:uridine kinase